MIAEWSQPCMNSARAEGMAREDICSTLAILELTGVVSPQHGLLGHHPASDWHADAMVIPKLRIGNANR